MPVEHLQRFPIAASLHFALDADAVEHELHAMPGMTASDQVLKWSAMLPVL